MFRCDWLVFHSCDWRVSILAASDLFPRWSAVLRLTDPVVVFLDRGHPHGETITVYYYIIILYYVVCIVHSILGYMLLCIIQYILRVSFTSRVQGS